MHYVEQGEGFPVLLLHGFPEMWYSWRYQIPALAEAGFRAIAPDMRGYGETHKPEGIEAYDMEHLVGDMIGLLDALEIEKAVIVGHDWGGVIVWPMAWMHPERMERVISLNVPFHGRAPIRPTEGFKRIPDGRFNYILYFQEPGRAEKDIEPDIDGWLERTVRGIAVQQDWITPETMAVFADAFKKGGITGPINYYRNVDRNWELTAPLAGTQITPPALMVSADKDPILRPETTQGMEAVVPNLTRHLVLESGHWTQQEQPGEVNRVIIEFLQDLQG
jgi:pimeloyl-ACP methyl ester carboxylesterase